MSEIREIVRRKFGNNLKKDTVYGTETVMEISPGYLKTAVDFLFRNLKMRLIWPVVTALGGSYRIDYWFILDSQNSMVVLRTKADRKKPEIDSLSGIIEGIRWAETEMKKKWGIDIQGAVEPQYGPYSSLPAGKKKEPILIGAKRVLPDSDSMFYSAADYAALNVTGDRTEGIELKLTERAAGIDNMAGKTDLRKIVFIAERAWFNSSAAAALAFALAVEHAAAAEIPQRASYLRVLALEMERIRAHLFRLTSIGSYMGHKPVWIKCGSMLEKMMALCEHVFGNRYHFGIVELGGVAYDIQEEARIYLSQRIGAFSEFAVTMSNYIKKDQYVRKGLGIPAVPKSRARAYGAVGPAARASGIAVDVRKDSPYAVYSDIDFKVAAGRGGTVYVKVALLLEEIKQSVKIIESILKCLKDEEIRLRAGFDIPSEGFGIGRTESPSGEIFCYIGLHGGTVPDRVNMKHPFMMNLCLMESVAVGISPHSAALAINSELYTGCV